MGDERYTEIMRNMYADWEASTRLPLDMGRLRFREPEREPLDQVAVFGIGEPVFDMFHLQSL